VLADNLDRLPDLREGDLDAGRRLVLAPQDEEGVVREGVLAHADVPDARSGHPSVDEPDDEVGIPVEGRRDEAELPRYHRHVGRRRSDEADARQPAKVEADLFLGRRPVSGREPSHRPVRPPLSAQLHVGAPVHG
jgi:hypothetical protein